MRDLSASINPCSPGYVNTISQTKLSYSYLQVPASQEVNIVVQGTRSDTHTTTLWTRDELNQIVA